MKVSIVVSACDNREKLFERSLRSLARQTMPKSEFEVVMVDDADRKGLLDLCMAGAEQGIRIQYIRIDPSKSHVPAAAFTPALTNNVGFRHAKGNVVVITGPETIHGRMNVEIASQVPENRCEYGLVFRAGRKFAEWLDEHPERADLSVEKLLGAPGAQEDCRTRLPHPPAYWYWMAVQKKNVEAIGGCDEEFMMGICGDDDDFANRMRMSGVIPVFNHKMIGIHQDHSDTDKNDNHSVRFTSKWSVLRKINLALLRKRLQSGDPVANRDHVWGSADTVVSALELT